MNQRIRRGLEVIYWGVLAGLLVAGFLLFRQPGGMTENELAILLTLMGWVNGGLLFFAVLKGGLENWWRRVGWLLIFFVSVVASLALFITAIGTFSSILPELMIVVSFVALAAIPLTWAGLLFFSVRDRDYLSMCHLILLAVNVLVMGWMTSVGALPDLAMVMEFFDRGEVLLAVGFIGLLWQGAYYFQARKFQWGIAYGVLGWGVIVIILTILGSLFSRVLQNISQW